MSLKKKLVESVGFRRLAAPFVTRIRQSPGLLARARQFKRIAGMPAANAWKPGSNTVDARHKVDFRGFVPESFSGDIGLISRADDPVIPSFHSALELLGLQGRVLDPAADGFHDEILQNPERILLCRLGHSTNLERQMFWEKTLALYENPNWNIFPDCRALRIYEAKRELAYFLKINGIPHPETHVFYDMDEALAFARHCDLPQVFKTNTGSAGVGVEILQSRKQLTALIKELFRRHYIKKSMIDYRDIDYGHIILQKFLSPVREFRVIKIGESWFGHEKMRGEGELMSGSGVNAWTPPPTDLLDFCHSIAETYGFVVMCFDVFQSNDGPFLINEMQTWFGSYDSSQMYIDGIPGRYIRVGEEWVFQPGFFNQIGSIPLILTSYINQFVAKG